MLVVVGGGAGSRGGHDGVGGGGGGGAQAGRHRGAGGRRQGQPLSTSTSLLATPKVLVCLLFWCFGLIALSLSSCFKLAYRAWAWRHRMSRAECTFKCCFRLSTFKSWNSNFQMLVKLSTFKCWNSNFHTPPNQLAGYLGRVLSSSMEVW